MQVPNDPNREEPENEIGDSRQGTVSESGVRKYRNINTSSLKACKLLPKVFDRVALKHSEKEVEDGEHEDRSECCPDNELMASLHRNSKQEYSD